MSYLDRKSKRIFSKPVCRPTYTGITLTMLVFNHSTTRRCHPQLLKCTAPSRRNFVPLHSILISYLPNTNCLESSRVWLCSPPNPVDGQGLEPGGTPRELGTRNWRAKLDLLQPQRVIHVFMSRNRPSVEGMLGKGEGECASECWNCYVHNNSSHFWEWLGLGKLLIVIALNFGTKNHHQRQQLQRANKNTLCGGNYHTLTQEV